VPILFLICSLPLKGCSPLPDSNPYENGHLQRLDRQRTWQQASRAGPPTPRPRILSLHAGDAGWPRAEKPQPPIPAPAELRQPGPEVAEDVIGAPRPHPDTKPSPKVPTLPAKAIKATIVVAPADVLAIPVRDTARTLVRIDVGGRHVAVDLSTKSVRKAKAAISEHGPDNVAAVLQGKLGVGDVLSECGLLVQPKAPPKPANGEG
jgi:hypothetical protein